ncbi:hypothetical protein CR513_00061, partial [Mucuna pruriens]
MTGEEYMSQDLKPKKGGWVTFGGNQNDKVVGIGRIGKHPFPSIDNVFYVKGLKHNLLSINKTICVRLIYLTKQNVTCLVSIYDDIWHKKLSHASLRLISNLKKHNLPKGQNCYILIC